jgi:hypothetical protein
MAPVLADEVFQLIQSKLKEPNGGDDEIPPWPAPVVARYPWEKAAWYAAD